MKYTTEWVDAENVYHDVDFEVPDTASRETVRELGRIAAGRAKREHEEKALGPADRARRNALVEAIRGEARG